MLIKLGFQFQNDIELPSWPKVKERLTIKTVQTRFDPTMVNPVDKLILM